MHSRRGRKCSTVWTCMYALCCLRACLPLPPPYPSSLPSSVSLSLCLKQLLHNLVAMTLLWLRYDIIYRPIDIMELAIISHIITSTTAHVYCINYRPTTHVMWYVHVHVACTRIMHSCTCMYMYIHVCISPMHACDIYTGFVGLFDFLLLLPFVLIWDVAGIERFELPPTPNVWTLMLVNAFIGTVLSELLWLW